MKRPDRTTGFARWIGAVLKAAALERVLLFLGGFCCGVLVLALGVQRFELKREIDVSPTIHLGILVVVGYLVQHQYSRRLEGLKLQRAFLVEQVKISVSLLAGLASIWNNLAASGSSAQTKHEAVVGGLKALSGSLADIGDLLSQAEIGTDVNEDARLALLELKRALTGGTYPNVIYTAAKAVELDRRAAIVRTCLFRLILEITGS